MTRALTPKSKQFRSRRVARRFKLGGGAGDVELPNEVERS